MLFTMRAISSASVGIFTLLFFCVAVTSLHEPCCPIARPPSCDCSNTPDGYELRCPAFTVKVKPKAAVNIQCDTNVVSDFSVLNGTHIGEVDTFILGLCPLPSVSMSQIMSNMGVSNVSNVQFTNTGVNGNLPTTVTREIFLGLSNVTSLTLHTDGITQLTDDVFTHMPNLTFIHLKSDKLVLSKDIFYSVMKLEILQLGSNNPTYLEPGVFHNLIHLQLLVLWGNMLNLSKAVFSDIDNLQSLNINSTKITSLPSDLFADLSKLRKINFDANELLSMPHNIFRNNPMLETVSVQNNRKTLNTLPSRMLADLSKLKVVILRNCNMSTLPEDLLWGSASIHTMSLNNNAFTTLPQMLFKECMKLVTLDISYNRITDLPNQLFSSVKNLKYLKMNNNRLSVITKYLLSSLRNLVVLDLKDNRLTFIETQAFEKLFSLKAVNMSNNMLTFDDTSKNETMDLSPLKLCYMLEDIQLANNSLTKIFTDWRYLWNLATLNLAYNKISQLPFADLHFLSVNNTSVNVSYNKISEIDIVGVIKNIEIANFKITTESVSYIHHKLRINLPVRRIFIEGNLIKCDCKIPSFYLRFTPHAAIFKFMMETNRRNLLCVKSEEYRENQVQFFPLKYFACLIKKRYSLNCPEKCSCLLMISDKALLLNCNQGNPTATSKREEMLHNLSRAVFTEARNLEFLEIDSIKMHSLPPDVFQDVIKLRYINFYGNDFLSFPQNLFVNNQNLNAINIENNRRTLNTLPPRLLSNLTELETVTLRNCNMSTLPEDLLWGSESIQTISLNKNAFNTLPELLFKDCTKLVTLDISYNRITYLPNRLFASVTGLFILKINNNQLSTIPKNLLFFLRDLEVLDMKDNRLRHIEPQTFIALKHLRLVDMSNNLLTFEDVSKTSPIGLSPFKFCHSLEDIQLANNSLTKIFNDWQELENLRTLNLAHNKISQIQAEDLDFIVTKNTFINISYNNISDIDIFNAKRVYKYESVTARYNVPVKHFLIEGNPVNCECKVYRFLQYNRQDVIAEIKLTIKTNSSSLYCVKLEAYTGQVLQKIPNTYFTCLLKTEYRLNCPEQCSCLLLLTTKTLAVECHQTYPTSVLSGENVVHKLTRDTFSDVHNLESLDIKSNKMTVLPPDLFVDLIKLRKICLYANKFQSLPHNLFASNPDLEMIYIENNRRTLKTLPPRLLAELTKLKEVKLNNCNIYTLPENLLWRSTSINSISLNNNAFTTLPELLFRDCSELKSLDISFNRITNLPNQLFVVTRNLETLKINNNQLTVITNYLFSFMNKLEVLDLNYNRLTHIEQKAFGSLSSLKAVNMSNNVLAFEDIWSPLVSCRKLEDIQLANNSLTNTYFDWRNLENLQTLNLAHNKISQLWAEDLYFYSKKNTFVNVSYNNISEIVIFDSESDINYVPEINIYNIPLRYILTEGNPVNCLCKVYSLLQYVGNDITANIKLTLETEPRNLCVKPDGNTGQLNENIPIKYFTCLFKKEYKLNCPEQCSCLFRTSDKALTVDCQQRNLTSVPGALPDIKFSSYTELNLSRNRIKSVKFLQGPGYYKVTKFIFSDNMISEIDLTAFSLKLQVLELDGNNITEFNESSIEFLMSSTYLAQLTLHNNPWKCDCTTKKFVTLIQSIYNLRKIKLLEKVTCKNGKAILKSVHTELCPESQVAIYASYTVAALGLLIGLLLALYYKFKTGIRVWLYAHRCCLWFVREDELDQGKLYDAFVSYSHEDEAFVMDNLIPRLESEQYTLCLHQRDWIPGEFIPAQIIKSVEESRRTLIVLTPAFVESEWGRMEFRAAHKQALNEGRVKVIIIVCGDIPPTDKLDSELRSYLTMNTYVKWGDQYFWEKLRYAMPHSSELCKDIQLQGRS